MNVIIKSFVSFHVQSLDHHPLISFRILSFQCQLRSPYLQWTSPLLVRQWSSSTVESSLTPPLQSVLSGFGVTRKLSTTSRGSTCWEITPLSSTLQMKRTVAIPSLPSTPALQPMDWTRTVEVQSLGRHLSFQWGGMKVLFFQVSIWK